MEQPIKNEDPRCSGSLHQNESDEARTSVDIIAPDPAASDLLKLWQWNTHLIPLNGKGPRHGISKKQRGTFKWKHHHRSFYNEPSSADEVLEWAEAGTGVGLFTGAVSGVIVVETDYPDVFLGVPGVREILEGLVTPTADSTRGFHLFFKATSKNPSRALVVDGLQVAELHGDSRYVAVPPSQGKRFREGLSFWDVPLADLPEEILGLFTSPADSSGREESIEGNARVPIEGNGLPIAGNFPSMDNLLDPDDSPLVREVVRRLGGRGLRVHCPYHPPDEKSSGRFYCNKGQWVYADFHTRKTPFDQEEDTHSNQKVKTLPLQQVVCDLQTGYPTRKQDRHWIRVGKRVEGGEFIPSKPWRLKPEAYVWLAQFAGEAGLLNLPASNMPDLYSSDWTDEELQLLRFVGRWEPAHIYIFGGDDIPLARPWLSSVLDLTDAVVDRTLRKARDAGILKQTKPGVKGYGGRPALYQIQRNGG